ncbi:MAG TPA: hypothetical protein VLH18_00190 [Candidatus Limnocylindrales bacterium]|nr:hypothetical protein [Candidatus Limnocylindrales bacterium]
MLTEVIKDIRETEGKAEEIRRHALVESRRIILEAEQRALDLVRQFVAEGEARKREILATAEREAYEEVVPVGQRASAQVKLLQKVAQKRQEEAINMVMERIVKTDGRS